MVGDEHRHQAWGTFASGFLAGTGAGPHRRASGEPFPDRGGGRIGRFYGERWLRQEDLSRIESLPEEVLVGTGRGEAAFLGCDSSLPMIPAQENGLEGSSLKEHEGVHGRIFRS